MHEKNPNLMDISGDKVHMVNNVAKTLLSHVDSAIQEFCSDIYYDVEESPKVREIFHEVQGLQAAYTANIQPVPSDAGCLRQGSGPNGSLDCILLQFLDRQRKRRT